MAPSIAACGTLPGWLAVFRDLKQGADHWGGRAPLAVRGDWLNPEKACMAVGAQQFPWEWGMGPAGCPTGLVCSCPSMAVPAGHGQSRQACAFCCQHVCPSGGWESIFR